jgi:methylisocitrate lyase
VLANVTEFSLTPGFTLQELADAGVSAALYPLSAARAMARAAQVVYETILRDGSQNNALHLMQTRVDLYDALGYEAYEKKYDDLFRDQAEQ